MSYSIKYQLEYSGLGGFETTINIKKRNYSGPIIQLKGSDNPFQLVYEANEEYQFTIFKNSYCNLQIIETPQLRSDFIEIQDEDDYVLEYRRNGVLKWSGYIMAEQYTEGDDVNQPWIDLKFYDAISRLKIYNINDLNLTNKKTYSLKEIFSSVNTLLYNNLNPSGDFIFNDFLTNSYSSNKLPDIIYIRRNSFFDRDNIEINIYDVLSNLGTTFNLTYLLYIDRLCITNFEFSDNPKFIDYSNLGNIISYNKRTSLDNNHIFINQSKQKTFWDSLKKIEYKHIYENNLNFVDVNEFNSTERLGSFSTATLPQVINNEIIFNSFSNELAPYPNKDYRKVSISNSVRFNVNNPNSYWLIPGLYRLVFDYKFDFEYNVTDADIQFMIPADANLARQRRLELQEKTTFSCFFNLDNNDVAEATGGQQFLIFYFKDGTQSDASFINLGKDFSIYQSGDIFNRTLFFFEGNNDIRFKFYQPNLHIDTLSSGNNHTYTNVKLTISNLRLLRVDREDLKESIFEGVTDRNVFNYNLNRNRTFQYINVPEGNYINNLFNPIGGTISEKSFRRRTKDYTSIRIESFDIQDYLVNQSLEQLGLQQEYVTGDLMVKNSDFDILSSLFFDGKIYGIHRYRLNDYDANYEIELIEIK